MRVASGKLPSRSSAPAANPMSQKHRSTTPYFRRPAPLHEFAAAATRNTGPDALGSATAAYLLWSTTVTAQGFLTRPSILMSKHWMDKVWSWDHCFNAIALAESHPELAWDQFLAVFDHQDERGALPDSVAHSEVLYNFVKPPIHGWALEQFRSRLNAPLTHETDRHGICTAVGVDHVLAQRPPSARACPAALPARQRQRLGQRFVLRQRARGRNGGPGVFPHSPTGDAGGVGRGVGSR